MSFWNTPAGRSNQLCKSPSSGCTAHAGRCDRFISPGEWNGVCSVFPATAEYAVRLRSKRTCIASGRLGFVSMVDCSHFRLARSSSLTYWSRRASKRQLASLGVQTLGIGLTRKRPELGLFLETPDNSVKVLVGLRLMAQKGMH